MPKKNLGEIYNLTVDNVERPVGVDNPTRYLAGKLVRIRRDGRRLPINLLSKAGIGSFGTAVRLKATIPFPLNTGERH